MLSESGYQAIFDIGNDGNSRMIDIPTGKMEMSVSTSAQLVDKNDAIWYPLDEQPELIRYDKQTKSYTAFPVGVHFEKFNFCGEQEIALVNDKNELFLYNLTKKQLKPFLKNGVPLNIGGSVNELMAARDGTVWIASLNGLWKLKTQAGTCERLGKETGLSDERILCVREMPDGKLWMGTLFSGIQIYNPASGKVTIINQNGGLSNNTVAGILDDNQGDVWAATFDGLTVLAPSGEVLFELSEEDGLTHREFNRFSYLKTRDGKLLFGGVEGVNVFQPEQIKAAFSQKDSLKIYLTGIRFFDNKKGEDLLLRERFGEIRRINLPANHRYIYLDFGLSNYILPEKNNFSYRLKRDNEPNAEEIWTSLGYNAQLVLNDLPVGEYSILIRATDYKGRMTENPIVVEVKVHEFFYKTWWFYALLAVPFFLGGYFWIRHLLTERERLEEEVEKRTLQIRQDKSLIERQASELLELDEMKSRFFTNISHEFRTPLTIISGMVTQIRQHPEQWMEKGMELIHRNSNHLLSLINQILDLRKLESGALKPNLIQGNIVPYLRYLTESFAPMAESKGLHIHFLSAPPELVMDYDPEKMLHILSNLLSNAIKYTPSKGDIYVQIDHRAEAGQEWLQIRVQDTGQGISPEALPYIFDRFYQVEDLASQKPQGSGIGLALTQELVKLLKGTIEVQSTVGTGTTFFVNFPIQKEAPLQEGRIQSQDNKSRTFTDAKKPENTPVVAGGTEHAGIPETTEEGTVEDGMPFVLLVEDNADVRLYITAFLENRYRVMTANDGGEGIRMATEHVPDLIISDVMMPVKDGFELCDTLKNDERTSHIPIILLTAKADFESKMSGLRKGADVYLTKPFEQEELLVRLEQLLALRKKLQERYQHAAQTSPVPSPEEFDLEDAFVQKLRQLVMDNISEEDFGIDQLCRGLGVSRTQLHNKVKALTNQSTSEFVRMVRLHKAKELLRTTNLNVSEVGYEVGFSNPAYFSRIYSEAFGEPPGTARKG
ncbi:MAG: response regulator [Lewinellaceae bacterium]|nr:response regulator [Lewinellaceae bacterium]